ncbi:hypothetical protein RhiirC2_804944 [Rhizophagus irregularis]|uniref:Uncharacterized protein n=1 Tax=Rhizophagus irregularis TaxID=588596 RepID=A0A2N1KW06_9GLOM|nr:hypothetical protein RhiirC2_804944 [Rhizophagus irregularis]
MIFIIKCSNIKFLDIIGILQPFYKYTEAEIRISNVKICKFIQKFIIIYTNSNIELSKLIVTIKSEIYKNFLYDRR